MRSFRPFRLPKKTVFYIQRNYRQKSEQFQSEQQQSSNVSQVQSDKKCQTKNLVLNYRSIIKKMLNEFLNKGIIEEGKKTDVEIICKQMENSTNLQMLRGVLRNKWLRTLLIKTRQSGQFMQYILDSQMYLQNKLYCIRFINKLFNAFTKPELLRRWIEFKHPRSNKKRSSKLSTIIEHEEKQISGSNEQQIKLEPLLLQKVESIYDQRERTKGYENARRLQIRQHRKLLDEFSNDHDMEEEMPITRGIIIKSTDPDLKNLL